MTETTTKDQVDAENLVDAAARAATEAAGKTLATLEPEQVKFTEHQVAILRQIGLEDATQGDLDLFFHVCRTTGLDPFRRQIYMIGRNTKLTEWVEDERATNGRRKVEKWVTKYTIQTGIDGFRRNGREAAKALGDSIAFDGPYWCGEDGEWREVWPAETPPVAAKYTVFRNGEPFSAVVHYDEFVQTNAVYEGSGQQRRKVADEPNSMWAKMPRNQTAKCAEAMAYRRAYPDDFSGLILEDSAQSTVIDQDGNVESAPKQRPADRTGGLRARARAATEDVQEPIDAETVDVPAEPGQGVGNDVGEGAETSSSAEPSTPPRDQAPALSEAARRKWLNRMFALFGEVACTERDEQVAVEKAISGREVLEHRDDLTDDELRAVVNQLNAWDKAGTIGAELTKILGPPPVESETTTEPVQEK
jgi:phage recombination protein Bet